MVSAPAGRRVALSEFLPLLRVSQILFNDIDHFFCCGFLRINCALATDLYHFVNLFLRCIFMSSVGVLGLKDCNRAWTSRGLLVPLEALSQLLVQAP